MASQPPQQPPPDSVTLGQFSGLKNTVSRERLKPDELETGINIDIDDVGQVRRRRGQTLKLSGTWHSIIGPLAGKTYGVQNGTLGIIRPGPVFASLGVSVGAGPVGYTTVNEEVYFSSPSMSGVVSKNEVVRAWGQTNGQGFWDSPVYSPTDTLGVVRGTLLGDPPPNATQLEAFHGRIYLAVHKTLWRTELYRYNYVDRTKGFYQFEHEITMVAAVDDGLYVGTTGGLYFLAEERILMRMFGSLKLERIIDGYVVPGSVAGLPVDVVRPGAMEQPVGTGTAIIFLTDAGVMAGFNSGETFNITLGKMNFPLGQQAAGLFRQDQGANQYIAAVDSAGGPAANARIGDFIDAEVRRFQGG